MKLFTSDLHFTHKNICNFTERSKFTPSEDHDQWVIDLWNNQVQMHDIVYHLGDFIFTKNYEQMADIVSQLNGEIHLVVGNHDSTKKLMKLKDDGLVATVNQYTETKIHNTKTCMFHYPIMVWNQQGNGAYHLHGHCHSSLKTSKGKMLDVGLDNAYKHLGEHRFYTEDDIADFMHQQKIYTPDGH